MRLHGQFIPNIEMSGIVQFISINNIIEENENGCYWEKKLITCQMVKDTINISLK